MKNPESKSSFYFPLLLLDPPRRKGLAVLYAFCRSADDLSDEPGTASAKRRRFALFRRELESALRGRPKDAGWERFSGVVQRFRMDPANFREILSGVERDLGPVRFRSFKDLEAYAGKVAGAPGRAAMEIFGGRTQAHRRYAEALGLYLQVVNVVRDIVEDRNLGRLYLPLEDFRRFGVDWKNPKPGSAWDALVRFELDRVRTAWREARAALPPAQRSRLATAEAIASVYGVLERKLYRTPALALEGRTCLSFLEKLGATFSAGAACAWGRLGTPSKDACCD